jgi:hypothetical protein
MNCDTAKAKSLPNPKSMLTSDYNAITPSKTSLQISKIAKVSDL